MLQAAQQAQHAAAAAEKAAQQAASRHEDEKKQLQEQLAKLKQVTVMQPLSHHSTLSHARASSVAMDQKCNPCGGVHLQLCLVSAWRVAGRPQDTPYYTACQPFNIVRHNIHA